MYKESVENIKIMLGGYKFVCVSVAVCNFIIL